MTWGESCRPVVSVRRKTASSRSPFGTRPATPLRASGWLRGDGLVANPRRAVAVARGAVVGLADEETSASVGEVEVDRCSVSTLAAHPAMCMQHTHAPAAGFRSGVRQKKKQVWQTYLRT